MGPAASAATHSRSSLRFLTPSTTVAGPSMDNAYWWAKNAGDWPTAKAEIQKRGGLFGSTMSTYDADEWDWNNPR